MCFENRGTRDSHRYVVDVVVTGNGSGGLEKGTLDRSGRDGGMARERQISK
jgi:hypothetical protein